MEWMKALKDQNSRRVALLELKEHENQTAFRKLLKDHEDFLLSFLTDEDSKVRKLTAGLLAATQEEKYRDLLIEVYFNESQLMIRGALAKNLQYFDLTGYIDKLEEREKELIDQLQQKMTKHIKEELQALRKILKPYRTLPIHEFTGLKKAVPMILLMPSGHQEALIDELTWLDAKKVHLGVSVKTSNLTKLYENRLFSGIYFPLCKLSGTDEVTILKEKLAQRIVRFLNTCHQGNFAYRIRIDAVVPQMAKSIAEILEKDSQGALQNQPQDYEIEVVVRENKNHEMLIYLRLLTIPDPRFIYRKKISSTSIAGTTAALLLHYLQDYEPVDGKVIDALCNDGTLLIERCLREKPHFAMGLDTSSDLMNKAKYNAHLAGVDIHFVQRNLQTFTHRKPFDEWLSVLPGRHQFKNISELEMCYQQVFDKIPQLVKSNGIAAFYTEETNLFEQIHKRQKNVKLLMKKIIIGRKYLYVLQVSAKKSRDGF